MPHKCTPAVKRPAQRPAYGQSRQSPLFGDCYRDQVTDCTTGKRGKVPASAIQEVRETTGAAPPTTTAPEKKKGYTYSSLPSLTGGPKRKIYKQPKKR